MNFSFLIHGSARKRRQIYWKKIIELEKFDGNIEKLQAHNGFCMLKNCLQSSAKVVVLLENQYKFRMDDKDSKSNNTTQARHDCE